MVNKESTKITRCARCDCNDIRIIATFRMPNGLEELVLRECRQCGRRKKTVEHVSAGQMLFCRRP